MRRVATILAACLCATSACRGGAAQEPYDGVVVTGRAAERVLPAAPAPVDHAEPMASEVDVRWTIALLSDAEARHVDAARRIAVRESEPTIGETIADEPAADIAVAADFPADVHIGLHQPEDKQPASRSCPGVVKGRS